MASDKRLLLWDIDATLITTAGAGDKALKRVIARRYGVDDDLHDIEIAGRTDAAIARSILAKYGAIAPGSAGCQPAGHGSLPRPSGGDANAEWQCMSKSVSGRLPETAGSPRDESVRLADWQPALPENGKEAIDAFLNEYIDELGKLLPQLEGRVLPGVREILDRMHRNQDRVLALLTGNLQRGAQLKLERYGLWDFFEFGAFADDHHDRNELGAFARQRAREKHGHEFDAARVDVIGDTGHDIACGKIFGARTIAVATGSWTRAQLTTHDPDFLFDDLSQVEEVIATLGW